MQKYHVTMIQDKLVCNTTYTQQPLPYPKIMALLFIGPHWWCTLLNGILYYWYHWTYRYFPLILMTLIILLYLSYKSETTALSVATTTQTTLHWVTWITKYEEYRLVWAKYDNKVWLTEQIMLYSGPESIGIIADLEVGPGYSCCPLVTLMQCITRWLVWHKNFSPDLPLQLSYRLSTHVMVASSLDHVLHVIHHFCHAPCILLCNFLCNNTYLTAISTLTLLVV